MSLGLNLYLGLLLLLLLLLLIETLHFVVVPVSYLQLVWTHFVVVVPKVDQRFEQERKKKELLERLRLYLLVR